VTGVSVYAGNSAGTPHTAVIDYMFDTSAPIVPEDGGAVSLDVSVSGAGTVTKNPDLATYEVDDVVELSAVPDAGWIFDRWEGDLTGTDNPLLHTMTGDAAGTAVFIPDPAVSPPVISNINVSAGETTATITWTTDEPATSVVDYGLTSSYTDFEENLTLVTSHSVVLPGLTSETEYHFEIVSEDVDGNATGSGDLTFTTQTVVAFGFVSDDFSSGVLDPNVWTFIDPRSDSSVTMTGTAAEIAVPSDDFHSVWTNGNFLPRLRQDVADTDFEVEVKFDSSVTTDQQLQGILIEEDESHVIRIEFHHYLGQTKVFAATLFGSSASIKTQKSIVLSAPMYLRVGRLGDQWTIRYSGDGTNWTTATTFSQAMTVTGVSVYAGNSAGTPHTAVIDYVVDTAMP
jgi:hypothetical protein